MIAQGFKAVLLTSVMGSILSLVLLIAKPVTKRFFGTVWQYYAWLMVLAVMVLPVSITLPQNEHVSYSTANVQAVNEIKQTDNAPANPAPQAQAITPQPLQTVIAAANDSSADIMNIISYLWSIGVIVILSLRLLNYALFNRLIGKHIISSVKLGKITLIKTNTVSSPLIIGLFKPRLLLPNINIPDDRLEYILMHELMHYKRHDLLYKWFVMIVSAVHWFNPLIYIVSKQIDEECEMSCDFSVVKDMDDIQQREYMNTILSLIVPKSPKRLTTAMSSSKTQIKRRFTMIKNKRKIGRLATVISVVTAATILSSTVFASGVLSHAVNSMSSDDPITVEVYNGAKRLELNHKPMVSDGEIYLPLRDTLESFGITQMSYDNGQIDIALPIIEIQEESRPVYIPAAESCTLTIGSRDTSFSPDDITCHMSYAPLLLDGVTYAPVTFFEHVRYYGQIPYFNIDLIQSGNPEDYVAPGEEVFIGTGQQQNDYRPVDDKGNPKLVKRIIVTDAYKVMGIVTVQNQTHDVIADKMPGNSAYYLPDFNNLHSLSSNAPNVYGDYFEIYQDIFIGEGLNITAYIPAGYIINKPSRFNFMRERDIASAEDVVREYYRALNAGDEESLLSCMTDLNRDPSITRVLPEPGTVNLKAIHPYDENNPMRDSYLLNGRGALYGIPRSNVIVLTVDYELKAQGAMADQSFDNWSITLIRSDRSSPWLIDDQGY